MATLSVTDLTEGGATTLVGQSVTVTQDVMPNTPGRTFLEVWNGNAGGTLGVTVVAQTTAAQKGGFGNVTKSNASVQIAASGRAIVGPFAQAFNNSSGMVTVQYSATPSVSARGFNMPLPTE